MPGFFSFSCFRHYTAGRSVTNLDFFAPIFLPTITKEGKGTSQADYWISSEVLSNTKIMSSLLQIDFYSWWLHRLCNFFSSNILLGCFLSFQSILQSCYSLEVSPPSVNTMVVLSFFVQKRLAGCLAEERQIFTCLLVLQV